MYNKNFIYYLIDILIIALIRIVPTNVYADTYSDTFEESGGKGIRIADRGDLGDLEQFNGSGTDSAKLKSMTGIVLGVIQIIGTISSVVVLMVLGIKYMLGSVEEKAEYKKNFVPYLVGAVLLFAGTAIPQLIYQIMKGFR